MDSDGTERTSFVKATPSAAQSVAKIAGLEARIVRLEARVSVLEGASREIDQEELFNDES